MVSHPSSLTARKRRSPETSSKVPASASGRTRIGVLRPLVRRDSISCRCFSSSKRIRYWNGDGRMAAIGMDRSAACSLMLPPGFWANQDASKGRAEKFTDPLATARACLRTVNVTNRITHRRLAKCCSIDVRQLSRNSPMRSSCTPRQAPGVGCRAFNPWPPSDSMGGTMKQLRLMIPGVVALALGVGCATGRPDADDAVKEAQDTVDMFKKTDISLDNFFSRAAGYAVFPTVGKGGLVAGGAYGSGVLFDHGGAVGKTSLTQVTVGFQLGG